MTSGNDPDFRETLYRLMDVLAEAERKLSEAREERTRGSGVEDSDDLRLREEQWLAAAEQLRHLTPSLTVGL